jgi:hypothetical protein
MVQENHITKVVLQEWKEQQNNEQNNEQSKELLKEF